MRYSEPHFSLLGLAVMMMGGSCDGLGPSDVPEAVNRAFLWALDESRLPDTSLLLKDSQVRVLERVVHPSWLSPPPGVRIEFYSEEELDSLATEEGAFMYLEFSEIELKPEGYVELVLSSQWTGLPEPETIRLSGGMIKLRVTKHFCSWAVKEQYRLVSQNPGLEGWRGFSEGATTEVSRRSPPPSCHDERFVSDEAERPCNSCCRG